LAINTSSFGATEPAVYQTLRGLYADGFYVFAVPAAGTYQVVLKFAETYWTSPGQRQFNVNINGQTVLSQFDVIAQAGTNLKAVDKQFTVTPSSGMIRIDLIHGTNPNVDGNQIISGIQITQVPTVSPCDVNQDGATNILDVQQDVNAALGMIAFSSIYDMNKDGLCNVIDAQRVINAALGAQCVSP